MDTMDTMARDLLMLKLSQLPLLNQVMDIMAMDMDTILVMAMDTTDTMARGQLQLNLAMDIMVMDMDMAMVMDMATDTMDTMARGLLNLAMDTMAMDMDMDMVMVMVMAMVMDTMDKSIFMLLLRLSSVQLKLIITDQVKIHPDLRNISYEIEKKK